MHFFFFLLAASCTAFSWLFPLSGWQASWLHQMTDVAQKLVWVRLNSIFESFSFLIFLVVQVEEERVLLVITWKLNATSSMLMVINFFIPKIHQRNNLQQIWSVLFILIGLKIKMPQMNYGNLIIMRYFLKLEMLW